MRRTSATLAACKNDTAEPSRHCDQPRKEKHNGSGEALAEPSCPLRPSKNKRCAPAGCRAEPYFFLPISPSHGQSPWDYFYSFCRRSCALPMLSLFPICRPCGERESFQTRNLGRIQGSYGGSAPMKIIKIRNYPGCVVSCMRVPTEGVWGLTAPAGCRAEPYCFFPTGIALSEASVIPVGFFPFPIPWTKSMGVKCFGVSCIRDFGACKPASWAVIKIQTRPVARAPRTTGREEKSKPWGLGPQTPLENNKDSNPPCCPRSANNREGRKKEKNGGYSPPNP